MNVFLFTRLLMAKIQFIIILIITCVLLITGSCERIDNQSYDEILFTPGLSYETLKDIDGNVYKTIQIGTQIWMAENLKVSNYSDGTPITLLSEPSQWKESLTGAYCKNSDVYGFFYNYYAAVDKKNICPAGWHLPDNSDWTKLGIFLGGESVAGDKLKESGIVHWGNHNTRATNESGFTALPGGLRDHLGSIYSLGNSEGGAGYWWSATETDAVYAWHYSLGGEASYVFKSPFSVKNSGFSIRCIKD